MSALPQSLVNQPYKHGFVTDIESDVAAKGLNEDTIRLISTKKREPEWLLEFRLKAFRHRLTMTPPEWANVKYPKIDFQAISYYSAPKAEQKLASVDEVDPELLSAAAVVAAQASFAHLSEHDQDRLDAITLLLDEQIRPYLQGDGGDLHVLGLEGDRLVVHYQGACGTCPSSISGTLRGIENLLRTIEPGIEVVAA